MLNMKNLTKPLNKLTDVEVRRIHECIYDYGARAASDALGISRLAMSNALAGLDVQHGTIALIRQNFSNLEKLSA